MNRKITLLISLFVVLSFILSACAQATPAPQPTQPPAKAEPTKAPEATKAPAPAATKAPEPTKAPASKYSEAPMLAEQVKAGKLPAVDQRVSEQPLVLKAIEEIGQYGGVWRRAWKGPSDLHA